jgi:hypothetical protein
LKTPNLPINHNIETFCLKKLKEVVGRGTVKLITWTTSKRKVYKQKEVVNVLSLILITKEPKRY